MENTVVAEEKKSQTSQTSEKRLRTKRRWQKTSEKGVGKRDQEKETRATSDRLLAVGLTSIKIP